MSGWFLKLTPNRSKTSRSIQLAAGHTDETLSRPSSPAAAPAAGVVVVFAAPGIEGVFAAADSFKAAARAFASAILAARSRSACEGLFAGSPTSGDLPPGG